MADAVTLVEVGPRDGLQNEPRPIATEDKIRLIDSLTDCGFARIEVASFVNPRLVPQMADGAAVMAGIRRASGVTYAALTPNLKGFEAALAAGADRSPSSPRHRRASPGPTSTPPSPKASRASRW